MRVLSACVCPCVPICFDADWINCVFGVREKREREKTTEEKNREGDVGLGDFQALCELRKRGGG